MDYPAHPMLCNRRLQVAIWELGTEKSDVTVSIITIISALLLDVKFSLDFSLGSQLHHHEISFSVTLVPVLADTAKKLTKILYFGVEFFKAWVKIQGVSNIRKYKWFQGRWQSCISSFVHCCMSLSCPEFPKLFAYLDRSVMQCSLK